MSDNWEKEVVPGTVPTVQYQVKRLRPLAEVQARAAYDPRDYSRLLERLPGDTTIVVYPPPLFIMSPRTRVYLAKDIQTYKGYLHSFKPSDQGVGEPALSCLISVTGTGEES